MPCKIKVKNLYLLNYFFDSDGAILLIEFCADRYWTFETGEQASKIKEILVEDLAIPEEEINVYMVE